MSYMHNVELKHHKEKIKSNHVSYCTLTHAHHSMPVSPWNGQSISLTFLHNPPSVPNRRSSAFLFSWQWEQAWTLPHTPTVMLFELWGHTCTGGAPAHDDLCVSARAEERQKMARNRSVKVSSVLSHIRKSVWKESHWRQEVRQGQ